MQETEELGMKEKQQETGQRPPIWDCGSSLYDSFERKAFEKQLDSAISSRTLSMPHLSDRRLQQPTPQISSKKPSRFSRSLNKLLRSVFRPKQSHMLGGQGKAGEAGFYVAYDTSSTLSTIPEAPEFDGLSPEIRSLVTRTASERFPATSIGIYCA